MIENEILILRKISHPNIVKLLEEFETPKEIYLVMELVPVSEINTHFSLSHLLFQRTSLSFGLICHTTVIPYFELKKTN